MANINVMDLIEKFSRIKQENDYRVRARSEEAEKTAQILARIAPEDVQRLVKYVPDIADITKFTAEEIKQNRNREVERIQGMYNTLVKILETKLEQYQDML